MMRPEPSHLSLTRLDRPFDAEMGEVRQMLARARPEQIRRLMDDIRDSGASDDARGTA